MPEKKNLESAIEKAATAFAVEIINAVKSSTLQELIALQGGEKKKPGRKPGPKPKAAKKRAKPGPKPKATKVKEKPGPKPKAAKKAVATAAPVKKKRVVKNYPKCAFPSCKKNRFPRGKGFCGTHWKQFEAGKIKAASTYKKKK